MAKKASSASGSKKSGTPEGMTDLRIRIDSRVHQKIKQFAEGSEISINQLVCGILEANLDKMHVGEADVDRNGVVVAQPTPKCVFVGKPGGYFTEADEDSGFLDEINEKHGMSKRPGDISSHGELWFTLDYSGRPIRYGRRE